MRGALLLGAFAVLAPTAVSAQDLSVLVGGVSTRYADSVTGSAGLLDGRLRLRQGAASEMVEASLARFASGEWAGQVGLQGLAARALSRTTALGLALGGSLNLLEGGIWSSSLSGGPFWARSAGPLTTSVAVALGAARDVDSNAFLLGSLTLGAQYERGPWRWQAAATGNAGDTLRFADWTTGITRRWASASLAVSGGIRAGDLRGDPWGQVRLEAALTRSVGLEAAIGTYPRDVTGFIGGRFATLGLRVGLVRAGATLAHSVVSIQRLKGNQARVTLEFNEAKTVAIAGDWNDWSPAPMSRTKTGRWTTVIRVEPGVHHYTLFVDGTRWAVPEGAPRGSDDFGGQAGLLIVPEA